MPKSIQLNLPPAQLKNVSQSDDLRKKVSQDGLITPDQADIVASQLFHDALEIADISSKFVAKHLNVSESLVSRWRSPAYRELPSLSQMLQLPLSFHLGLHKAMNRKFGLGRALLSELLDGLGALALVVNE